LRVNATSGSQMLWHLDPAGDVAMAKQSPLQTANLDELKTRLGDAIEELKELVTSIRAQTEKSARVNEASRRSRAASHAARS
jgi:hypothetical protein